MGRAEHLPLTPLPHSARCCLRIALWVSRSKKAKPIRALSSKRRHTMDKLLASIPEASLAIGCGRSHLYELMGAGKIESVKSGTRRLVVVESLKAYVASLRAAA